MSSTVINEKHRYSNLELFRIVAMLFIVAHHYVVLSALPEVLAADTGIKAYIMTVFGAWGKTGINCFVLITGYFMCMSHITLKKYVKLVAEVGFYVVLGYFIFIPGGVNQLSLTAFTKAVLFPFVVTTEFIGGYLLFFLFIPFWNLLLKHMTQKQHGLLILLCFAIYSCLGSVPKIRLPFNYVTWFSVIYFIGAYIRLYPNMDLFKKRLKWKLSLSIAIGVLSIVSLKYLSILLHKQDFWFAYYEMVDSNKFIPTVVAIFAFCFFKDWQMDYHPWINKVAASAFGVLLIHSNSWAMMDWLWKKMLNNAGFYHTPYTFIHAIGSVILVYAVCTVIDIGRIRFLERPFLMWFEQHEKGVENGLVAGVRKIMTVCGLM